MGSPKKASSFYIASPCISNSIYAIHLSMESHGLFATCLDCADGRTKEPVLAWARKNIGVQWVDILTRAGMDGVLVSDLHPALVEDLRNQLGILLEKHHSKHILVVGHCECAGNPVSEDEHRTCIKQACEVVCSWNLPEGIEVVGLLVNSTWEVEVVS